MKTLNTYMKHFQKFPNFLAWGAETQAVTILLPKTGHGDSSAGFGAEILGECALSCLGLEKQIRYSSV